MMELKVPQASSENVLMMIEHEYAEDV